MNEKEETGQVTETTQVSDDSPLAMSTKEQETEKPSAAVKSSIEDNEDEPVPHLHAKTYLTVFAVCLIYFAQLINVVGAGAVRNLPVRAPDKAD
jgi:hypothetical protein